MEQPVRTFKKTLRAEIHRFLNGIPSAQIENERKIYAAWNKANIEMVKIRSPQDYFSLKIDEFGFIGMAYDLDGNRLGYSGEE
ncbi:hypothetical protein C2G38_2171512 [Gigaspora rosea]|uniref:Uncharacterized protein n=1 Tax=Gigaspora rosea TaxID=44941 RepID=A0A397VQT7_9GLOM|nr:hypothetical protein C2G38_2171512 [Gigaspora rosea]